MDIKIENEEDVTVVKLEGDIDANTAPEVQDEVLPLAKPESKILLDMTEVPYTSSAGLRMLLSLYRQVSAKDGRLVLVGLSEEIKDTMSITGFLDFFTTSDNQEEALKVLSSKQTPDASHQEKDKGSKAEL
ncbi:anti-sigma factor antagonist [Phormidium sp. LEGE 05292]|uniref:anti-sigma factor antagonist n=1 Tax=[Phormidium] sp. LEGE 05292 TaxID=767427 RepID=UPI00187FC558|nr:anti-sigma factor antagonist [Phormidium sp. LEGE 05292]MBE9224586.1 anti-sigma factor antagonist [Phormidium sp. LEGE 05292]